MENQVKEKLDAGNSRPAVTLKHAKQYLQKGDLTEIAGEAGVTRAQVSNVLAGRSKNWEIVKKVLERAERNKQLADRGQSI